MVSPVVAKLLSAPQFFTYPVLNKLCFMIAFQASWVLPVNQPPIQNGVVIVDDKSKIVYVGSQNQMPNCTAVKGLDGRTILPGLVNAHTHLEFSDLKEPLGTPGMEFTRWIKEVVALRSSQSQSESTKEFAIKSGFQECVDHATSAIGEIATSPMLTEHYANQQDCLLTVFQEALGASQDDYGRKFSEIKSTSDELIEHGIAAAISPHAPYSVPPMLLAGLLDLARETGAAVAMHLAETREEREFIEHRSGPFVEMLKEFGVWQPDMYEAEDSILNILKTLARAKRALVIHGNYLNADELDFIATLKERMSVVFCPRTHRYFRHAEYPIESILKRGINLAVGTDSRTSNPDLNLMSELKEIRHRFPDVSPDAILKMGTLNGAKALGVDDQVGTLEEGRAGRFCVAELPDINDPYSWLL